MRDVREFTIGTHVFKIERLGAKLGKKVLARLIRSFGPAFEADDTVTKLVEQLTDEQLDYFCDTFAASTRLSPTDKPELEWQLKDRFDDIFSGHYGHMSLWLKSCVETNYADFLSELGVTADTVTTLLSNVPAAMMAGTKAKMAKEGTA
jgi:hypothetical protein